MRNKYLFDNPKDIKIAKLQLMITKFKKYDQKRKQYYADKLQRLGELESWYDEIKSEVGEPEQLKIKVAEQKEEIKKLKKFIELSKIRTDLNEDELNESITIENLKRQNKNLRERSKVMKKTLENLILKLSKLEGHEHIQEES